MKKLSKREARAGLTLIEVIVMLAICFVVIAMVMPAMRPVKHSRMVECMSHLKQIDVGFLLYADDNKGKLPVQEIVSDGGTAELVQSNSTGAPYRKLATYFQRSDILICPTEKYRRAVTNFNDLTDTNLSYFLNADAALSNNPAASILAGDRNLQVNGRPLSPGLFVLTTNLDMNWTRELHLFGGNLAFADGHVQFCRTNTLNALVQGQSVGTNRLLVP